MNELKKRAALEIKGDFMWFGNLSLWYWASDAVSVILCAFAGRNGIENEKIPDSEDVGLFIQKMKLQLRSKSLPGYIIWTPNLRGIRGGQTQLMGSFRRS